MPFMTVAQAEDNIPSIKNLTKAQKKTFLRIFNELERDGIEESSAIAQAISAAKTLNKSNMRKDKIIEAFSEFIDKHFGEPDNVELPVIKQFQEEKMQAVEWLYPLEKADLHGEQMDRETIEKMVHSLNKANQEKRLAQAIDHVVETDGCYLIKAWINETDCYIGDHFIPEGWPLAKMQFTSKSLWDARKEGKLCGLSIGAKGNKEEVDDA